MKRGIFFFLGLATALLAAEKPKAPAGFSWKVFKEAHCEIQVPHGWDARKTTAGITHLVRISPEKIVEGKGISTGLTMNAIVCSTQKEWAEAMQLASSLMVDAREATGHPVESRVEEKEDTLLMVLEEERFIPGAPHPEKKYRVRAIVRAFPKFGTIYMYSFGAPVEDWDKAWKKAA